MIDWSAAAEFIQANARYAGALSFAIALLGSFLGTNLVVPAGAALTAAGVLVGAGLLPWTIVIWGAAGASLGTTLSYAIGLRIGPRVMNLWPLRQSPWIMQRAQALFQRYGVPAILIAYFSGPLRAPVASVAAMAGMPRLQFEISNIVIAFVWAIYAVGLGAVPGTFIDPNSPWLLIGPVLVPTITVALSAVILAARRMYQTKRR